jgi:vancomycin aglycone glucosyltransferase
LKSVADGADLLLVGITEKGLAANIAEYYGIPLAALHFFPAPPAGDALTDRSGQAANESCGTG